MNLLFEFSFFGVLIGLTLVGKKILFSLKKRERIFIYWTLIAGFFLRLRYGIFAPLHEHDHYIGILLNIRNNYLSGDFFSAPDFRWCSNGFYEFFYHRFIYFTPNFSVENIFMVSVFLSVLTGFLLFSFVMIYFKNKRMAFTSLIFYISLPIMIKLSATETMFILSAFTLFLFLSLIFITLENPSVRNVCITIAVFVSNLIGRIDFGVMFLFICLCFFIYTISIKKYRNVIFNSNETKIMVVSFFVISAVFIASLFSFNASYGNDEIRELVTDNILERNLDIFNLVGFFGEDYHTITFFNFIITPFYFYIFFVLSYFYVLKEKKYTFIVFLFLLVLQIMITFFDFDSPKLSMTRRFIPYVPFIIIQASYFIQKILSRFKLDKRLFFVFILVLVSISFFQNIQFLETETARKMEQDFLTENLAEVPDNSLILTIAEKKYVDSVFHRNQEYYTLQHGLEFPSYLLPPEKNIDVMDIYTEYNPYSVRKYENVFYYRGIYSYHENMAPAITEYFEKEHELDLIDFKNIENYDFDVDTANNFLNRKSFSIVTDEKTMYVAFYKVNSSSMPSSYDTENFTSMFFGEKY